MATPALARLETLLREKKLDRTLTSALPALDPRDDRLVAATEVPAFDRRLRGGLPRGHVSECFGARSSGRTSVAAAALAAATRRQEIAALVDPLDAFDPESAAEAGVDLQRLLWIRGQALSTRRPSLPQEWGGLHALVDRGLKALTLVLQTGHFGLVVFDLIDVPAAIVRRLPFTTWLRVQRLIEGTETVCLLLGDESIARSAGGLSVSLPRERPPADGAGPRAPALRLFPRPAIEPHVVAARSALLRDDGQP